MSSGVRVVGAPIGAGTDETAGSDEPVTAVLDERTAPTIDDDAGAEDGNGAGGGSADDGGFDGGSVDQGGVDDGGATGATTDRARASRVGRNQRPSGRPGRRRDPEVRRRRRVLLSVSAVAVLGVAGTAGFGLAWAGQESAAAGQSAAKASAAKFLTALTNFNAKTVDADFSAITNMATGAFASQANKFFNSSIRQELEDALASSRGQIRSIYLQSYSGNQASVYAVVDQLYANNKITAPQSDVLRVVADLSNTSHGWKIADVTVLTGPSPTAGAATGTSSGSTGTSSGSSTGALTTTTTTAPPAG